MAKQKTSLRKRAPKSLAGIACAGVFLGSILIGCATGQRGGLFGNYGQLKSSKEVTREFTNYEVKDNLNYFIAGARKDSPSAILGLDNRYTLSNPRFWYPLNSQDKTLQELVEKMQDASESGDTPYGANVLGPNGNDIGDWYSTANRTTIRTKDGKTFTIYTPSAGGHGSGGGSSSSGTGGGSGGSGN